MPAWCAARSTCRPRKHPTRRPRQGNTVGLYLSGGSDDELTVIFDRLAIGADPDLLDELAERPFGIYGHLADRYGLHWFFRGEGAICD